MNELTKTGLRVNYWFLMAISGLMLVGGLVAIIFFVRTNIMANKKIAETAEAKRPANLEIISISDASCTDCFNINQVLTYIKQENVTVTTEKTLSNTSEEGKQLIQQFAIKKLPALILKGELDKLPKLADFFAQAGDMANDTFVFRQPGAPYTMVDSGTVRGRVQLTLLSDVGCTTCYDVTQHETILQRNFGITVPAKVLDAKSAAGRAFIKKYNITLVPTFVLTGEPNEYSSLTEAWQDVGTIAADGAYIFTGVPLMGTYHNLLTNKTITPSTTQP